MTRDQWFEEPNRAIELGKLLRDPLFQLALTVMDREGPSKRINHVPDVLANGASTLYLGKIQGYQDFQDILLGLAELMPEHKLPKETYGAKEEGKDD